MPRFISITTKELITKKGIRGYPIFYMVLTFISLFYIDTLFRYLNFNILFNAGSVHIIFVDLIVASLLIITLIAFSKRIRTGFLHIVVFLFSLVAFNKTMFGIDYFDGLQRLNQGFYYW